MTLEQIMRHLYRNEINCAISCFWDGGWDVKLGDAINKFKAEDNFDTLPECAAWLEARAREFYPKAFESETPVQHECRCVSACRKDGLRPSEYCRKDRAAFDKLQLDRGIRSGSASDRGEKQ